MVEIQPNNKWPIMRGKILAAKFEKNKTCTQNITPYMSRKGPVSCSGMLDFVED